MNVYRAVGLALLLYSSSLTNPVLAKPFMIVGLDQKILWDDDGKAILSLDGKDQVVIVDLANPEDTQNRGKPAA